MLKGSYLISPWSDPAEFQIIQSFMSVIVRWKNEEDPIKNVDTRAVTT